MTTNELLEDGLHLLDLELEEFLEDEYFDELLDDDDDWDIEEDNWEDEDNFDTIDFTDSDDWDIDLTDDEI